MVARGSAVDRTRSGILESGQSRIEVIEEVVVPLPRLGFDGVSGRRGVVIAGWCRHLRGGGRMILPARVRRPWSRVFTRRNAHGTSVIQGPHVESRRAFNPWPLSVWVVALLVVLVAAAWVGHLLWDAYFSAGHPVPGEQLTP